MDESSTTQNRRSRRSHLLMSATIEWSGRSQAVKLRNLSSEGAQVEGDELPVEGADLLFRKGELAVAGKVIWTRDKSAGISFARQLNPEQVLNHIPTPKPRMVGSPGTELEFAL